MTTHSAPHNKESSARLRELIKQKREQGQLGVALTLAKIGRRVVLQSSHSLVKDEASRKAFELYLEINPNDQDVKQALAELPAFIPVQLSQLPQKLITPKRFKPAYAAAALVGLLVTGAAVHFPMAASTKQTAQNIESPQAFAQTQSSAQSASASSVNSSVAMATNTSPIVIRAVGDVVLGTDYPKAKLPNEDQQKRIAELSQSLVHADVVFGNLEGVLSDNGKPRKEFKSGYYSFRMPTAYADLLKKMGFDVVSIANNHSLDFGNEGLQSTVKSLNEKTIKVSGVPASGAAIVEAQNTKIAFLSYSYLSHFTRMDNEAQIAADIAKAKEQAALVFVSVHAGGEGEDFAEVPDNEEYYRHEYRGNIRKFSEFVIDAGASGVFGHGPHVVRPFEIYKQKPIFYSLGNFIGFRTLSTKGKLVQSIIAEVRFNPDGTFLGAGIIPLKMDDVGIPSADYTYKTLSNLDDLLNENLDKQPPLLVLKATAPVI